MANNNRQPNGGILLSPSWEGDKLRITAEVVRGGQAQRNVSVVFFQDNLAVVGGSYPTDQNGKASHLFKVPAGATTMRIKVEASVNGIISKDITVGIPAGAPNQPRQTLPTLFVEDVRFSDTRHRLAMAIFNANGQMQDGLAQLSSSRLVRINTPQPTTLRHTGRHRVPTPRVQSNQPNNAFETSFDTHRWTIIDIEHDSAFELDVLVAGWNRKIELTFNGPHLNNHLQVPPSRSILLAAFFSLFIVGLLVSFTASLSTALVLALVLAIVSGFMMVSGARIYNRRIRINSNQAHPGLSAAFVATNNATLATMFFLDLVMIIVFLITLYYHPGPPILTRDNRTAMTEQQRQQERKPGDDAQSIRNIQRNLGPVRDRDLVKQLETEQSWEPVVVVLVVMILMIIITLCYIPVAASDEAASVWHTLTRRLNRSHSEGSSGGGWWDQLISRFRPAVQVNSDGVRVEPQPPAEGGNTPPRAPQNPPRTGVSWVQSIVSTIVFDILFDSLFSVVRRWFRRDRDDNNRRRRAEA